MGVTRLKVSPQPARQNGPNLVPFHPSSTSVCYAGYRTQGFTLYYLGSTSLGDFIAQLFLGAESAVVRNWQLTQSQLPMLTLSPGGGKNLERYDSSMAMRRCDCRSHFGLASISLRYASGLTNSTPESWFNALRPLVLRPP